MIAFNKSPYDRVAKNNMTTHGAPVPATFLFKCRYANNKVERLCDICKIHIYIYTYVQ